MITQTGAWLPNLLQKSLLNLEADASTHTFRMNEQY